MTTTSAEVTARLDRLFAPPAVTLVGATPNSHATTALVRNITRPDAPYQGPLHLVNPNRPEVLGRPTVPSLDAVEGDLGLVYLLVGAGRTRQMLADIGEHGLADRITGLVVYAAGFAEAGDQAGQHSLVEAAQELGLPLLGPQSTGVISAPAQLVAVTDPVPERFVPGRVGVVAQSTGLLGGAVSWLMRRGIGVGAAVGFGNGAALGFAELAPVLLHRDDIDVVCVYVDALADLDGIVALGRASQATGKPVVLYRGAQTAAARRLALSHTGMLATGERAVSGVAEQHGVLVADTFEELLWGAELFVRNDVRALRDARVGVITGSGGGGLIAAETIERAGITLDAPAAATLRALELPDAQHANPLDVGAIALDRADAYGGIVRTFAEDPGFGVVVKVGSLGAPSEAMPTHHAMTGAFVTAVRAAGKLPVLAFSFPEDPRDYRETVPWEGVLVVGGDAELAGKLRLLTAWADSPVRRDPAVPAPRTATDRGEGAGTDQAEGTDAGQVADDTVGAALAAELGLRLPRSRTVTTDAEVPAALAELGWPDRPVVAKTARALPHRAAVGGVVVGLRDAEEIRATVRYLRARFGAAVTLAEQVAHDEAYFVGLQRDPRGRPLLAFGVGVATDNSPVQIRLCPLDDAAADALVARAQATLGRAPAEGLRELLLAASALIATRTDVAVVDMNPIVAATDPGAGGSGPAGGALVALDVKVYPALSPSGED